MAHRYSVCVDFDGVIHRYDTPFIDDHTIPDNPVEGAIEWLTEISEHFDVVVLTTRARTETGCRAVSDWLVTHGIQGDSFSVTAVKPPALVYLDDRAIRFTGANWPTRGDIHRALPWHKVQP